MTPAKSLATRLEAALLPGEAPDRDGRPTTVDLILDAAVRRFVAVGIKGATMSSIATDAGISREWLYRNFANKDAIVTGVVHRELRRFIDGLAGSVPWTDDVTALLTETFVYCVEFFRDLPVLDGLLSQEEPLHPDGFRARAAGVVSLAVNSCAEYMVDLGGFDPQRAAQVAETLVRLVGSTVVVPVGRLDLHDPDVLRDYAARVVPAVVHCC